MTTEIPPAPPPAATQDFRVLLSSTPRGARLGRLLVGQQLADWGWPYDGAVSEAAAQIVAELDLPR